MFLTPTPKLLKAILGSNYLYGCLLPDQLVLIQILSNLVIASSLVSKSTSKLSNCATYWQEKASEMLSTRFMNLRSLQLSQGAHHIMLVFCFCFIFGLSFSLLIISSK